MWGVRGLGAGTADTLKQSVQCSNLCPYLQPAASPSPSQALHLAWGCLLQSVQHANLRPYVQLFLSRLLSLHPEGVRSLLLPALLDYGQASYQVGGGGCTQSPLLHSPLHPLLHSSLHSPLHSSLHSPLHPLLHSPLHPLLHPPTHPPTHPLLLQRRSPSPSSSSPSTTSSQPPRPLHRPLPPLLTVHPPHLTAFISRQEALMAVMAFQLLMAVDVLNGACSCVYCTPCCLGLCIIDMLSGYPYR